MATITFDTYEFVETLREAGIPEKQAKAIVDGIKKIDMNHVASKDDVAAAKVEIENKMLEMKASLIQWMVGLVFVQAGLIIAILKFAN